MWGATSAPGEKSHLRPRAPMEIVRSGFPMERIAVNILGELPIIERGNRYILMIGDYFTKCYAEYGGRHSSLDIN